MARRIVRALLTRREFAVLCRLCAGQQPRQIAVELAVAKRTVDFHLLNAYRKLDVHNRMQALRRAEELGIL